MLRTLVGLVLLGSLLGITAFAQAPSFDVASVRASKATPYDLKGQNPFEITPSGLTVRGGSLLTCLAWAYDVKEFQISGPAWLASERYDIVAKAAGGAPPDQMRLMLQALLAERLKVTLHHDKKEMPVYALMQGKNPPKLRPSDEQSAGMKVNGANVTIPKISMPQLAEMLSKQMDRPVVDMTAMKGSYDLTFDVSSALEGGRDKAQNPMIGAKIMLGRSLSSIVTEQLGMKLDGQKLPTDVLVINHAEKVPTQN